MLMCVVAYLQKAVWQGMKVGIIDDWNFLPFNELNKNGQELSFKKANAYYSKLTLKENFFEWYEENEIGAILIKCVIW